MFNPYNYYFLQDDSRVIGGRTIQRSRCFYAASYQAPHIILGRVRGSVFD